MRSSSFVWVGGWLPVLLFFVFLLPLALVVLAVYGLAQLVMWLNRYVSTRRGRGLPHPVAPRVGLPGRYSQQCLACGRIVEAQ